MALKNYRELKVWQTSMDLVLEIYQLSKSFPDDERYGLTNQIRRAVVLVPANIAEGYGRSSTGAYRNHLSIATGSLMEVETELIIGGKLEYVSREQAEKAWDLIRQTSKMLFTLSKSLNEKS